MSIDSNTVALVTGGSRGIGLMIARGFVEAGARVYISARNADACEAAAAELSKHGVCVALPADLATEAEARRLANEISAREPVLHVLVNNAGANWGAPLAEFPDSAWDKVLALNVKAMLHLTRCAAPAARDPRQAADPARAVIKHRLDRDGLHSPRSRPTPTRHKAAVHHRPVCSPRSSRRGRSR